MLLDHRTPGPSSCQHARDPNAVFLSRSQGLSIVVADRLHPTASSGVILSVEPGNEVQSGFFPLIPLELSSDSLERPVRVGPKRRDAGRARSPVSSARFRQPLERVDARKPRNRLRALGVAAAKVSLE